MEINSRAERIVRVQRRAGPDAFVHAVCHRKVSPARRRRAIGSVAAIEDAGVRADIQLRASGIQRRDGVHIGTGSEWWPFFCAVGIQGDHLGWISVGAQRRKVGDATRADRGHSTMHRAGCGVHQRGRRSGCRSDGCWHEQTYCKETNGQTDQHGLSGRGARTGSAVERATC